MRLYLMPASGLNSKVVTTGPGLICTTLPSTLNSSNLDLMRAGDVLQFLLVVGAAAGNLVQQIGGRQLEEGACAGSGSGAAVTSAHRDGWRHGRQIFHLADRDLVDFGVLRLFGLGWHGSASAAFRRRLRVAAICPRARHRPVAGCRRLRPFLSRACAVCAVLRRFEALLRRAPGPSRGSAPARARAMPARRRARRSNHASGPANHSPSLASVKVETR